MWEYILYLFLRNAIEIFFVVFVLLNITTFFLYVIDKRKAEKNKWRISEFTLILFTLMCGAVGAYFGMRVARHKTKKKKFKIAVAISFIFTLIVMIHIAHSLTLDRIINYVEIEFRSENWPSELNGYRIAFITDKHNIEDETMRKIANELNEREINLLLLGGDFHYSVYENTLREIAKINTTDGIFGVDGNHDYCATSLFAAKRQHEITPLDNSGVQIHNGFYLAGVQDLWIRNPNIEKAIADANENDFILLITHNPDVSMIQPTAGIDLILAGHTHGGHVTFFGYPAFLLLRNITDYGTRFNRGFNHSADGVPVFTSVGLSSNAISPRAFARPEVIIFTMSGETKN